MTAPMDSSNDDETISIHLEDRGSFRAKNRYGLPPVMEIPKDNPYDPLRNTIAEAMGLTKKEAA